MSKKPARRPRESGATGSAPRSALGTRAALSPAADFRPWTLVPAVILITLAVFAPALRNQFVNWDDPDNILRNEHYRGLDAERLHWMFTTTHGGHYQPLSWVSLALDYICGRSLLGDGMDPRCYHLTNCLLHTASAALVGLLAIRLFTAAVRADAARPAWLLPGAAALAAMLFALHPLRVESVAWITERRDVLSSSLLLLALLLYARAPISPGALRWRWLALSLIVYALSLLSRSLGVILPPILLLLDWYPLQRFERTAGASFRPPILPALVEKLPYLALAAVFAVIAVRAQSAAGAALGLEQHGLVARAVQACYGLTFYVSKSVIPVRLSPIYEIYLPLNLVAARYVTAVVLVLAGLLALAWLTVRKRGRAIIVAAACYVLLVLPVSGVAQSGRQEVADRYSYLPGAVLAILVAGGVLWTCSAARMPTLLKRSVAVLSAGACVAFAGLTWRQCGVWRDSATLWSRAVVTQPSSAVAHNCYGCVLLSEKRYDDALGHLRRAVELRPAYGEAHMNIWRALEEAGRKDELLAAVYHALELGPQFAEAHYELARILAERGQAEAAMAEYRQTLALRPDHSAAHTNLAFMLRQRGQIAEALEHYQAATTAEPRNLIAWLGWADLLHSADRETEALSALHNAIQIAPQDPRARQLWQDWTNTPAPP